MSETPEDEPVVGGEPPSDEGVERRTLSEVVQANYDAAKLEQAERERVEKKKAREELQRTEHEKRLHRARAAKTQRIQNFTKAQSVMRGHIASASTELRRALRSATEVQLPRHSHEARAQLRIVRALEDAMGALRRAGRGASAALNADLDLDVDLDLEAS